MIVTPGSKGKPVDRPARDRDTPCPAWCQRPAAHVTGCDAAGETTHTCLVAEIRIGEIDGVRAAADRPLRVAVEAWTGPDGREQPPSVRLTLSCTDGPSPDGEDLTPAEARRLADSLRDAARIAET
jgi:hypothetical protein